MSQCGRGVEGQSCKSTCCVTWCPDLNVMHVISLAHCHRRETIPGLGVERVLKNKSWKMMPSKCAKNREKSNYLILFLIQCVEVCTSLSLSTNTHLFLLWKLATNFERRNTDKFCHWLDEAGIYPETSQRDKEALQVSNRKFKAVEKSLWIPLIDIVLMRAFSDDILLLWTMLLKIPCLLFSNINLLEPPLML